RVAAFQLTLQPLWEGLAERRWSEAQLKTIQGRLQQYDFIADLKRVLEAECAWGVLTIGLTRDNRPAAATVSLSDQKSKPEAGQFPESLDELAPRYLRSVPRDLIDGKPMRYQRTDDGSFLLYSIGWNEQDDHGEPGFVATGRNLEPKTGDWVWRYPAR